MQKFPINDYDYRCSGENSIQLYDNKRFVAEITYRLKDKELWITNLYRTEYGKMVKKPDRHYGTEIFSILLTHLFRNGEIFDYIIGRLSVNDAEQDYWLKSIPYYAGFERFVPAETDYRLAFYLFEDKESMYQKKYVRLPDYNKERETFQETVKAFQQEHIRQRKDAYFCYLVIREPQE